MIKESMGRPVGGEGSIPARRPLSICYYVSGHGLGHADRAAQVMECLPQDARLIVKTTAPEDFIRNGAKRPLEYVRTSFDTGAIQSSNFAIDWDRTFRETAAQMANREKILSTEARFLERERVDVVVSDIPPLPLAAAKLAGVPGVAIVNFTWVEILRKAAAGNKKRESLVQQICDDYSDATLALRTPMTFPMRYFPQRQDIPLIARTGRPQKTRLRRELGIPRGKSIVLLYFGNWGGSDFNYAALAQNCDIAFVSSFDMPAPVLHIEGGSWDYADLVASVDAVVAKPGYGTLACCMANATPVGFYPRPEFAEYPVLRKALMDWGGAVAIGKRDFFSGKWGNALEKAFELEATGVRADGARVAANAVTRVRR
ncbi:MAG: hypothetical protein K1X53_17010 [Candidatus Sumerlaeaceae bacterium]|nr:hypothetical protein [Candidatus Sumerlaeaceae bacterium]